MRHIFKITRQIRRSEKIRRWMYILLITTGVVFFFFRTNVVEHLSEGDISIVRRAVGDGDCQTVHVCVLCSDSNAIRQMVHMVKTLLFSRQTHLVFHFITDDRGAEIIHTLFKTWELPAVTVESHITTVEKMKTNLLQGANFILKELSNVLPDTVEKVIVLDAHAHFLDNVHHLWKEFDKFSDDQPVGMSHWPIPDGKGAIQYYIDVLLLRPQLLKMSSLHKNLPLSNFQSWVELQRFLNSHVNSVYNVTCMWNVRLEPDFPISQCIGDDQPKVLFWGTGADGYSEKGQLEPYKEAMLNILSSNSDMLRQSQTACFSVDYKSDQGDEFNFKDPCSAFKYHSTLKRRTHVSFISKGIYKPKSPYDVSLLTQMSIDRFQTFEKLAINWEGPISVAVHATEDEAERLVDLVSNSKILKDRHNIDYHLVYKRDKYYPINYVRNVAIDQSRTPYSLFLDVDLVPNPGMYTILMKAIEKHDMNNVTLVIPAFEAFKDLKTFPANKSQLLVEWDAKNVDGYKMWRGWNLGHKPTNFPKWKTATEPYEAIFADAFEPYIVIKTKVMPKYPEQLLERMGDKIAYGLEVFGMGFKFIVLPDVYVVHLPHPVSDGHVFWQKNGNYQRCGGIMMTEFKKEMKRKYPQRL